MSDIVNTEDFNDVLNDDSSVLVVILHGEAKQSDPNVNMIKQLFSDPYFIVQDFKPTNINDENLSIKEALSFAAQGPYVIDDNDNIQVQEWWKDHPCIIIKDSSISNISSSDMKIRITTALDKANKADLFFLCKWNDQCNKYTDVTSNLKWSNHPSATQAVMYTPESRNKIINLINNIPVGELLNAEISHGKLLATVFVPNIVDFDINLATSNTDYAKLNECAPVVNNNAPTNEVTIYIWIAAVVILMVIITIFIASITSR